ncbi:putative ATPase [Streptomyces canus]|uniref:ATP-binding protein n=1 Tax=Streptomyces canus TaxID=58343 RepID=UPI002782B706|nr:NB-ARC domain-containing protein [Streptomyces canus]MDQ0602243.1 putative ATPase [Streptomyces canus]
MSSEKTLPGNLPPDPGGFVGRQHELGWLAEKLAPSGERRPVTLVGVGGVGKTRLALRAAERAGAAYPDGVWLVELSPLRAEGQVPLAVMEALRLADRTAGPVAQALCAWVRDKRLLLVLDTCEHLLAECAALIADLLAVAPGVRVLVTSREPLDMPGERTLEVAPLRKPDATALFAQRAVTVTPGFVLDATARRQVGDLCRILDGIPLAIELAAARLSSHSLDQLHALLGDRLRSRFDVLAWEGTAEQGAPRHGTLRTAIGWSHELCAPLERLLWARLSVFAGSFTRRAAEWVCAGGPLPADQIENLLLRLTRQSVVLRHPADSDRFRLLDTVREYGADWLRELGEGKAVRRRHRDHYRRFAREACSDWNTGRQVAWCERVFAEQADLRAAVDCALEDPGSRVALETAGSIGFLWRHCGMLRDAQLALDRVLAVEHEPGEGLLLALWSRAAVAVTQGHPEAAVPWAERCMALARELGDPAAIDATGYVTLGPLVLTGRTAATIKALSDLPFVPVVSDWRGSGQLQMRAMRPLAHLMSGAYAEVDESAAELRALCAGSGELWTGAFVDAFIADADLAQGRTVAALDHARAALAGHRLMHNTAGVAFGIDALVAAEIGGEGGDGRRAARLLGISRRAWERVGKEQFSLPGRVAAREARERLLRDRLGDQAYEEAYARGMAMAYDEGVDYALS